MADITTTNYALLGLLALRDWSAYELVQQSQRLLRFLLPRAESKVYESVKRLVTLGLARSQGETIGGRRRTVYAITPSGRHALQAWLEEPSRGPVIEFEGALKLFFADSATQQDALATTDSIVAWSQRMLAFGAALGGEYVETDGGPYPERLHINALVNEFLIRHATMVLQWSEWARQQILDWDGVGPQPHRHSRDLETYVRACRAVQRPPVTSSSGE